MPCRMRDRRSCSGVPSIGQVASGFRSHPRRRHLRHANSCAFASAASTIAIAPASVSVGRSAVKGPDAGVASGVARLPRRRPARPARVLRSPAIPAARAFLRLKRARFARTFLLHPDPPPRAVLATLRVDTCIRRLQVVGQPRRAVLLRNQSSHLRPSHSRRRAEPRRHREPDQRRVRGNCSAQAAVAWQLVASS